jgi:hypothetical protein
VLILLFPEKWGVFQHIFHVATILKYNFFLVLNAKARGMFFLWKNNMKAMENDMAENSTHFKCS